MAAQTHVTPKRKDPKPRPVVGGMDYRVQLKNKDINKHYVWAYENAGHTGQGPEYFSMMGYRPVVAGKGTPEFGWGPAEEGKPIRSMGHVLMEVDLETRAEIEQFGADGQSGQNGADQLEARVIDKDVGVDLVRGIHPRRKRSGDLFVSPDYGHDAHVPDPGQE